MLKFIEMSLNKSGEHQNGKDIFAIMRSIASMLADSSLLLDECDVLLHPLRSELNFPVGQKEELAHREWRVGIAISAIHSFFKHEVIIKKGISGDDIQTSPHLILSNPDYYKESVLDRVAYDVAGWILNELATPDTHLVKLDENLLRNVSVTSCMASEEYKPESALLPGPGFWCSDEYPKNCVFDVTLNDETECIIGAIDITFVPLSSFFAKSGLSMLPSTTIVELSFNNGKSFQEVLRVGEFINKRLYLPQSITKKATVIRLRFTGISRWFAVQKLKVYSRPIMKDMSNFTAQEMLQKQKLLKDALIIPSKEDRKSAALDTACLTEANLTMVELAHTYISVYIPHCLGKTNSVSYGLVPENQQSGVDSQGLVESPIRRFMAVPFVGKDSPSPTAEFAHPDVLLTLSYLAYRHSGLRLSDVQVLVKTLKTRLRSESGVIMERKSYKKFEEILASTESPKETYSEVEILPLDMFEVEDMTATQELAQMIRYNPVAVEYYCRTVAFPKCLNHKESKLSATGEDLFICCRGASVGMSGTPSALLPKRMGRCDWEASTEGQIFRTLTRSTGVTMLPALQHGWEPILLLQQVATLGGDVCALIDCGALVTGMDKQSCCRITSCTWARSAKVPGRCLLG